MIDECLENIIGLSTNNCPCLPSNSEELVVNGSFDLDLSGWEIHTSATVWYWDTGQMCAPATGTPVPVSQIIQTSPGQSYTLTFDTTAIVAVSIGGGSNQMAAPGPNVFVFTALSDTTEIRFITDFNTPVCIDNVSVLSPVEDVSISGYYIDDGSTQAIDLIGLMDSRNCESPDNIWAVLRDIRKEAIRKFRLQFGMSLAVLPEKYHRQPYFIGDKKYGQGKPLAPLLNTDRFLFGCLRPVEFYRGQFFTINCIQLEFAQGYTDTLPFWLCDDVGNIVHSGNFNMVSGIAEVRERIRLPIMDKYGNEISYRIIYDRKEGFPKNYRWDCGCGGAARSWRAKFKMSSGSTNAFEDVKETECTEKYSMGLQIQAVSECDPLEFICDLDFTSDLYGQVIAETILMCARMELAAYLINQNKINVWTLCKKEHLLGKISHYKKEINYRLKWLVQEYKPTYSDCFLCSSVPGQHIREIKM